jgi:hypothetical protein
VYRGIAARRLVDHGTGFDDTLAPELPPLARLNRCGMSIHQRDHASAPEQGPVSDGNRRAERVEAGAGRADSGDGRCVYHGL